MHGSVEAPKMGHMLAAPDKGPAKHVFRGLWWSCCEIHYWTSVLCIISYCFCLCQTCSKNHAAKKHDRLPVPIPRLECFHSPCSISTCQRCHCMLSTCQCVAILEAGKAKPKSKPSGKRPVVQQCQRQFQTLLDRESQPRPPLRLLRLTCLLGLFCLGISVCRWVLVVRLFT